MKHTIILFALVGCFSAHLFAQAQKGSVLLGTSANLFGGLAVSNFGSPNKAGFVFAKKELKSSIDTFSFELSETTKSFNFSPTCGVFVSDGLALGVSLGIGQSTRTFGGLLDSKSKSTMVSFAPYLRYYFQYTPKTRPFFELSGGVFSQKGDDDDDRDSQNFFGGKIGSALFLNDRLSLDLFGELFYTSDKSKTFSGGTAKSSDTIIGLGLGFSYFLK